MKNDLYICVSYYHLLISILKNIDVKNKNDLIIATDFLDNKLMNDKELISRLKQSKIFKNIYFFDYSKKQLLYQTKKLKYAYYFYLMKKANIECKINFNDYNDIYIFNDVTLIGKVLNQKKIYYKLIEDGTDCFKKNYDYFTKKTTVFNLIKRKIFHIYGMGQSKFVLSIEVNDKNGIFINKPLIEEPKEKLFSNLNKKSKSEIFRIFISDKTFGEYKDLTLLITQPLFEDKRLHNESEQIQLYKYILKKYSNDSQIVIKTHPRETINYKQYFKNVILLDNPFPIEVLNFCENICFSKAITVSSTSLYSLNNVKNKIYLGWEWLENYKKEINYETKK